MEYITAIQQNQEGKIINVQTSTGRIISFQKAILETEEGILSGAAIRWNRDGEQLLINTLSEDGYFPESPHV
ncbi:hypothetical protein J2S13_000013 [Oikeobacillus pervagus]|uniref:DUF3892 domain-containing protein n=1 Tax=Oikeobacillus pervagus TaxID=1325931 RepID=A0AAJ1SW28_9BACI|nr:DUF3892 domain-containing protein [Oikeobacillus pervagus]MDQ0213619.1 hypothetical protein [Oikeobacillus pervagus]